MKIHAPRTVRRLAPRLRPADWVLRAGPQERCYRGPRWPERRRALPTPLPGAVPASSGSAGSRLVGIGRRTSRPAQGQLIGWNCRPMALKLFPKWKSFLLFSRQALQRQSVGGARTGSQQERFLRSQVLPLKSENWNDYSSSLWKGNYSHLSVGNGLSMQGQVETRSLPQASPN